MRPSRFTEEQIVGMLQEQEVGAKTVDVCRQHGISTATFCTFEATYGGMDVSDARRHSAPGYLSPIEYERTHDELT
jgi:putative transposase